MGYRVWVDRETCLSSGKCVANEPSAFRFDTEQIAEPIAEPSAEPAGTVGVTSTIADARLLAAARDCPSGAIRLRHSDLDVPID